MSSVKGSERFKKSSEKAERCIVCNTKVIKEKKCSGNPGILSRNMDIVFLFNELLQLPKIHLISSLKRLGDPNNWISLCDNCDSMTKEAVEVHYEIQKLERKKFDIRNKIVKKIKTLLPDQVSNLHGVDDEKIQLMTRLRNYVKKHTYELGVEQMVKSNRNGDRHATALVTGKRLTLMEDNEKTDFKAITNTIVIKIKVEDEEKVGIQGSCDEEDGEDESSSSNNLIEKKKQQKTKSARKRKVMVKNKPSDSDITSTKTKKERSKLKENQKWKCHLCDEVFEKPAERKKHENDKHKTTYGTFVCDLCGIERKTLTCLLQHKRRVHNLKPDGSLITSIKKSNPVKKSLQMCTVCNTKVYYLANHVRLVHDKKFRAFCSICGMGFWSQDAYTIHLLRKHKDDATTKQMIENGISIVRCPIVGCKGRYLNQAALDRHTTKMHGSGSKARFTCASCGKTFMYSSNLIKHEEIHLLDGKKPFSCDLCESTFVTRKYLRDHMKRLHSDDKLGKI